MLIPVLTEPEYRSYLWAKQAMEGITQEATRRKYKIVTLDAETYETIDYDKLFGSERRMLIIIGTSASWMPRALTFFTKLGIETVFISFDPAEVMLPTGMVRMDYVGATLHLLTYLSVDCARKRIAMYGFNPNSSADRIKLRFFQQWGKNADHAVAEDIFYNLADLQDCFRQFLPQVNKYDAVICSNDVVGVSLLSMLKQAEIRVPEDLYAAAYGNSMISERITPSLTIVTLDHPETGRQAVLLFSHLCKMPATACVSSRVRSKLIVRASTANVADTANDSAARSGVCENASSVNFYSDPEAERLLRAETLLNTCDDTDMRLIGGLLAGSSLDALEQALYLTTSALQYRKKRLMHVVKCQHTGEFVDFLKFCRDKGIM